MRRLARQKHSEEETSNKHTQDDAKTLLTSTALLCSGSLPLGGLLAGLVGGRRRRGLLGLGGLGGLGRRTSFALLCGGSLLLGGLLAGLDDAAAFLGLVALDGDFDDIEPLGLGGIATEST